MNMKTLLNAERAWPLGLATVFVVFVAINIAFVTLAFQNRPQLVSENYYAEGYNLREIAEKQAAGEASGWNVSVRPLPVEQADMPLVELTVTEADGTPADSLAGEVGFYRPSDKRLDVAPLPIQFVGSGRYLVFLPQPLAHGAWEAYVELKRDRRILEKRVNLFVEK
ncbi:FixH family protein [bacterium]|nr:FixH family protein [bacterium]MBU1984401.1 FixH family protein [bacterium]